MSGASFRTYSPRVCETLLCDAKSRPGATYCFLGRHRALRPRLAGLLRSCEIRSCIHKAATNGARQRFGGAVAVIAAGRFAIRVTEVELGEITVKVLLPAVLINSAHPALNRPGE